MIIGASRNLPFLRPVRLPVITDDTDAEFMILASARMHQDAIYKNWMKAYNVDQSDEEQFRVAPDPSQEIV